MLVVYKCLRLRSVGHSRVERPFTYAFGRVQVMQATNLFRDTLTSRIEPVYGLTTLHAALRSFKDAPLSPGATTEIRDGTYAFGLIALGKFFLRLPAEVLEEELPRLRSTLISVSSLLFPHPTPVPRLVSSGAPCDGELTDPFHPLPPTPLPVPLPLSP